MKRVLVLALIGACSAAQAQQYDVLLLASECGARQSILAMAIDGHTYGKEAAQVKGEVSGKYGKYLNGSIGQHIADSIVDYGYQQVPRGNSMQLTAGVVDMCMENPDQYIGTNFLLDKSKVPK